MWIIWGLICTDNNNMFKLNSTYNQFYIAYLLKLPFTVHSNILGCVISVKFNFSDLYNFYLFVDFILMARPKRFF